MLVQTYGGSEKWKKKKESKAKKYPKDKNIKGWSKDPSK